MCLLDAWDSNLLDVQVQRLIAVLSVPGVSRRKMLEGVSLDPGPELTLQERKQLEAAGWTPGTTIRSLLNFTGEHRTPVQICTPPQRRADSVVDVGKDVHCCIR